MTPEDAMNNLFKGEDPFVTMQERAVAIQNERMKETALNEKKFRQDCNRVAATPEGKALLKHIKNLCGYGQPCTTYNPLTGEMNPIASLYNQGRHNLWGEIRVHLPADVVAEIEAPPKEDLEWTETPTQQAIVPAP